MITSYWAFFGTLYLIILSWQDYKNGMLVDDRNNYLMIGLTISLYTHIIRSIPYILCLSLFCVVWFSLMKFFIKGVGEADFKALMWCMMGFAIISPMIAVGFWMIFLVGYLVFMSLKMAFIKYKESKGIKVIKETPFFGFILLTFIMTCIIYHLY